MAADVTYATVKWSVAGTTSDPISVVGDSFGILFTPGTLAGTSFTFLVSNSGENQGTYLPFKDETGAAFSMTVTTSSAYRLKLGDYGLIESMKIVSSASEAAGTTLIIAHRGVQ